MNLRRPAKDQPENFEFTSSSLEAAKNILTKLIIENTGETLSPNPSDKY